MSDHINVRCNQTKTQPKKLARGLEYYTYIETVDTILLGSQQKSKSAPMLFERIFILQPLSSMLLSYTTVRCI